MAINLFGECNGLSLSGIKNLKLLTKKTNGSRIIFPIDLIINNDIIIGSYGTGNSIIIGNNNYQYIEFTDNIIFNEEQITDRQGIYYKIEIEIKIPKIMVLTNVILNDFIFDNTSKFILANAFFIAIDNNDQIWIGGYNKSIYCETFENSIDNSDNYYDMKLISNDYNRIRLFNYV